jgi:hypothetical protein
MDQLMDGMMGTDEMNQLMNEETNPADGNPADNSPTNDQQADESQQADETQQDETQADEEGSGGGDGSFFPGFPSFTFPSFFRSFNGARRGRQLYTPCVDRITMPCIVEDFIGVGMGDVQACVPVHCGNSLCHHAGGGSACKIETSVTPFHLNMHFGDGKNKGNPEDNIGACLRYKQLPCA